VAPSALLEQSKYRQAFEGFSYAAPSETLLYARALSLLYFFMFVGFASVYSLFCYRFRDFPQIPPVPAS
jgi:ABC-type polysaccharide/polyol phosphate export permease